MDHIKAIEDALAAGPTPNKWQAPYKLKSEWGIYADDGLPLAKARRKADADLIAACHPEAIRSLLDRLREAEADARRYRWLRDVAWNRGTVYYFAERYGDDEWDEKIDENMAHDAAYKEATK